MHCPVNRIIVNETAEHLLRDSNMRVDVLQWLRTCTSHLHRITAAISDSQRESSMMRCHSTNYQISNDSRNTRRSKTSTTCPAPRAVFVAARSVHGVDSVHGWRRVRRISLAAWRACVQQVRVPVFGHSPLDGPHLKETSTPGSICPMWTFV